MRLSQIPCSKLTGNQAYIAAVLKVSFGHLGIKPSRHSPYNRVNSIIMYNRITSIIMYDRINFIVMNIRASMDTWLIVRENKENAHLSGAEMRRDYE